jgi:hypothetical protein
LQDSDLKKGDKKLYNFLRIFAVLFPNVDTKGIPVSKLFQKNINSVGEEELEKLRKEFVSHLLENPANSVFFIFSLAKLADDNND